MLEHPGMMQIRVDQQYGVVDFTGNTDGKVDRRQRLAFAFSRAGDGQYIPVVFLEALQDLGAQQVIGVRERTVFHACHNPVLAQDVMLHGNRLCLPVACFSGFSSG